MADDIEGSNGSGTDSLSVTSTVDSDLDKIYPLECILAERTKKSTNSIEYLIKWEGYPLALSTWEPPEVFIDVQGTLLDWQAQKTRIARGLTQPFDVRSFEEIRDDYNQAVATRKARRRARRKSLGLPVSACEQQLDDVAKAKSSFPSLVPSAAQSASLIKGDISFGEDAQNIGQVDLGDLAAPLLHDLQESFGQTLYFSFQNICLADDYHKYKVGRDFILDRDIIPGEHSRQSIDSLIQSLRSNIAGGVLVDERFTAVLYPGGPEAWRFVDFPTPASGARLRFQLRRSPSKTARLMPNAAPAASSSKHLSDSISALLDVDYKSLVPMMMKDGEKAENFFLIFSPQCALEYSMYRDFLHKSGASSIMSTEREGAWSSFGDKVGSGTILIHPSFTDIHQIPDLSKLIQRNFNVFEFGFNEDDDPAESSQSSSFSFCLRFVCTRLFAHGGVILLTDAVILNDPIAGHTILSWFKTYSKQRPPQAWKLAGRPGLKDWALATAQQKADEADDVEADRAVLEARFLVWTALDELLSPDGFLIDYEYAGMPCPSDEASVVWEDIPGYDVPGGRNPTEHLVEWFAGWAMTRATQFRKFIVVVPDMETGRPDEKLTGWGHLDVVTAKEFLAKYGQEGR